jgi:hypothetical protein
MTKAEAIKELKKAFKEFRNLKYNDTQKLIDEDLEELYQGVNEIEKELQKRSDRVKKAYDIVFNNIYYDKYSKTHNFLIDNNDSLTSEDNSKITNNLQEEIQYYDRLIDMFDKLENFYDRSSERYQRYSMIFEKIKYFTWKALQRELQRIDSREMELDFLPFFRGFGDLDLNQQFILAVLLKYAIAGWPFLMTNYELAELLFFDEKTINKHLDYLIKHKYIEVLEYNDNEEGITRELILPYLDYLYLNLNSYQYPI